VEDVGALVESRGHGPGALQRVDRSLNFVPALVDRLVEAGGPTALAATALAVGPLVLRLGDGVLDLASSQVTAVAAGGVRLISAEMVRPSPWTPAVQPGDADTLHDRDELRRVAPVTWGDQQGQWAASALTGEVDLAGQAAPGPSESLVGAVVPRRRPFFGTRGLALRAPAAC